MKNNLAVRVISLFCACFLLLLAADCLIPGNEADIYDGVVRLHILACSDSEADQEVKLKVRDAILNECGALFDSATDTSEAKEKVISAIPKMEEIADRVLAENGFDYRASAEWGREEYPTREYGDVTLPAGTYYSLRINLGSADGKNWWCVLFPPLCTGGSSKELTRSGVDRDSSGVFINKKYVFRFKILELFGW